MLYWRAYVRGTFYPEPQEVVDPARVELASKAPLESADTSSSVYPTAGVDAFGFRQQLL